MNSMIAFVTKDLQLGDYKRGSSIPFKFEGTNKYALSKEISFKGSCSCTTLNKSEVVQPGANFEIQGNINSKNFSKGVGVKKVIVMLDDQKIETLFLHYNII